ncbi:tRNA (guanosine(46)-N7)-methyltransferase TrmB [Mycoplasma hafezii]|uniref:tRNA (guanosine(46)-N7)-methyltransferase TrmB n=1 Tax=Mycoplasma hafezii TaxID=525886 RepID=UPI003CF28F98
MRLRHDNTAQDKLNASEFYIKDFPITLKNNNVLEIGAGKGEMISELAFRNPNITYFALEKYPTVANKILTKIKQRELKNLFILTEDAIKIPELFNGKIDTVWLTFSDPWPKKAHAKRRLTYKTFLDVYKQILSEEGFLYFKTDNDKLFEYSLESLTENNWEIIDSTTDLHKSKYNLENVQTGYEAKWASQGKNINFLIARPKR